MLFLRQLGWELFRLFARRCTYIGFGVFLAVEMLFYWLWTRERSQEGMERFIELIAGGFDEYFSRKLVSITSPKFLNYFITASVGKSNS
jgi:ABC-2 type transport system permease protein